MKKAVLSSILLLPLLVFSLAFVPSVHSDTSDIRFVSHSWYLDDQDILWVVGEVQNVGTSIIKTVSVNAEAVTSNGVTADPVTDRVWARYLFPGQKAPFAFPIDNTNSASSAWTGVPVTGVDLTVTEANATPLYQYTDVNIISHSYSINATDGHYWVKGQLQNLGTQTAEGVQVIAAFYNDAGVIVGAGYTNPTTPLSISPSGKALFELDAIDLNTFTVSPDRRIQSYYLFTQVLSPLNEAQGVVPTVSSTSNVGPAPTPLGSSGNGSGGDSSSLWIYIAAVVVVVAVFGGIVVIRMRKPKTKAAAQSRAFSKKQQKKLKKNTPK